MTNMKKKYEKVTRRCQYQIFAHICNLTLFLRKCITIIQTHRGPTIFFTNGPC